MGRFRIRWWDEPRPGGGAQHRRNIRTSLNLVSPGNTCIMYCHDVTRSVARHMDMERKLFRVQQGNANTFNPCRGVRKRLVNVQHLQSTYSAFAAILEDGSVVTWGDRRAGADSSQVKKRLRTPGHTWATFLLVKSNESIWGFCCSLSSAYVFASIWFMYRM